MDTEGEIIVVELEDDEIEVWWNALSQEERDACDKWWREISGQE